MNLTTLNLSYNPNVGQEISVFEVLTDVCEQFDSKIVLGIYLILTFYIMKNFIIPGAENQIKLMLKDNAKPMLDMVYSITETFAIGSIIMIIVFYITQNGISTGYIVWLSTLVLFIIASVYMRKKHERIRD